MPAERSEVCRRLSLGGGLKLHGAAFAREAKMSKFIDADALIERLSVDPVSCPGCPEPEFLPELIEILKQAQAADVVPRYWEDDGR